MTSLYFASCARPMISMSIGSFGPPPPHVRLPTASRPRLNFLAKASFTTATFGEPRTSARVELAAGDERHTHRAEVAGADFVEARVVVDVRAGRVALDFDIVAPVIASDQRHEGRRRRSRLASPRARLRVVRKAAATSPACMSSTPGRSERDDVLGLDAEIDVTDVEEALREQSGAGQKARVMESAICAVASVVRKRCAERALEGCRPDP